MSLTKLINMQFSITAPMVVASMSYLSVPKVGIWKGEWPMKILYFFSILILSLIILIASIKAFKIGLSGCIPSQLICNNTFRSGLMLLILSLIIFTQR